MYATSDIAYTAAVYARALHHSRSDRDASFEMLQVCAATSSADAQPCGPSEPDGTGALDSAGECSDDVTETWVDRR